MAIYLEDYKDWISTFATIATICQFLTGSKICRDFMRKGSTGEVSGMPLVVGALNSCCWFRYSLLINDTALIIVNGTGACLNTIWTVAYYLYTQRKFLIQIQVLPCNFVNVCISSDKCCSTPLLIKNTSLSRSVGQFGVPVLLPYQFKLLDVIFSHNFCDGGHLVVPSPVILSFCGIMGDNFGTDSVGPLSLACHRREGGHLVVNVLVSHVFLGVMSDH